VWKFAYMEVYSGLYNLASNKEALIADNFDSLSGSFQWNVSFLRSLNDWEVEDLASFYSLLYSYNLGGGVDKIWWVPNRKGKFEVRSFYNVIIYKVSCPFPWKSIWRIKALPRVAFLVWPTALGKIFTLDNLRKKNMVLGVGCAKGTRNPLIICFFIISVPNSYGMPFSVVLAWRGLCLMG
jgi:hypothetical protein